MKEFIIYSDGAYSPSRNQGGCAFVILEGDKKVFSFKKMFKNTTNQRMEVIAACIALESIKNPSKVKIYSDSAYLVCTINKGWKRKVNLDLWERLDKAIARHSEVTFEWVKGHDSNKYNAMADELAVEASNQVDIY